jgi:hypothetical protein
MCSIMSKWSHIGVDGDSIGRHIRQGFLMGLREDLIQGAILTDLEKQSANTGPYDHCRCDGQFSEAVICRQNDGVFHNITPRALGVCSHLPPVEQHFAFPALYNAFNDLAIHFPCEDPEYRYVIALIGFLSY